MSPLHILSAFNHRKLTFLINLKSLWNFNSIVPLPRLFFDFHINIVRPSTTTNTNIIISTAMLNISNLKWSHPCHPFFNSFRHVGGTLILTCNYNDVILLYATGTVFNERFKSCWWDVCVKCFCKDHFIVFGVYNNDVETAVMA